MKLPQEYSWKRSFTHAFASGTQKKEKRKESSRVEWNEIKSKRKYRGRMTKSFVSVQNTHKTSRGTGRGGGGEAQTHMTQKTY